MTTQTVVPSHVSIDDNGVAWIHGTRMKVTLIAEGYVSRCASPEELHEEYPYLTLGQIHSALSYYYDHEESLNTQIRRELEAAEKLQAAAEDFEPGEWNELLATAQATGAMKLEDVIARRHAERANLKATR